VGGSQPVGVTRGKEARVSATVVADRDGLSAKVDDLDQVRSAGLFASVVVVASMNRVDSAGCHRIIGLLVCRVEHWPSPLPEVVVSSSIEPRSNLLDHRAMGRTAPTNGGVSIG
jgi:hypothetical protein